MSGLVERRGSLDFSLIISTEMGDITLQLDIDAAPKTVEHITNLVQANLFNGTRCCFYRSDFVIQCGLQTPEVRAHWPSTTCRGPTFTLVYKDVLFSPPFPA